MPLKERIEEDFKQAVRQKEALRLSCLRMIKAAVKNKEIDNRGPLDEAQTVAILQTLAKQRRESIEQFKKGGRDDLAEKETAELAFIENYLPQQMSEEELGKIIDEIVQQTGAQGPKEMGKVMKLVIPKAGGRADGKLISELVKRKLGGG